MTTGPRAEIIRLLWLAAQHTMAQRQSGIIGDDVIFGALCSYVVGDNPVTTCDDVITFDQFSCASSFGLYPAAFEFSLGHALVTIDPQHLSNCWDAMTRDDLEGNSTTVSKQRLFAGHLISGKVLTHDYTILFRKTDESDPGELVGWARTPIHSGIRRPDTKTTTSSLI
jgi:hypothetical protein